MYPVVEKIRDFVNKSIRVFRISQRPTEDEFWLTAKVTGIGITLIGLIGFVIALIFMVIG